MARMAISRAVIDAEICGGPEAISGTVNSSSLVTTRSRRRRIGIIRRKGMSHLTTGPHPNVLSVVGHLEDIVNGPA